MAGHNVQGMNSAASLTHQVHASVVKTMVLVSAFFAVTRTPLYVYYIAMIVDTKARMFSSGYHTFLFIAFLYICTNPFIYATKFDPVKRVLLRMIPCKKTSVQAAEHIEIN